MKKLLQLLCMLICATPWASAQNANGGGARFYVQPSVIIAVPGDDFEPAAGISVAAGITFARNHSIEIEYLGFETSPEASWRGYDIEFEYLFAAYKYRFAITEKFSVYAGAFLGRVEQEIAPMGNAIFYFQTKPDDDVAGGLTGSVEYQFAPHISFFGGVKVIGQGATQFTTAGSLGIAQTGLKFRF